MSTFTVTEVRQHNHRDSLWIIHDGKVYDMTDFVERHPGGRDLLQDEGGGDVTGLLSSAHPHQHSGTAYSILHKFYIGDLTTGKNKRKVLNIYSLQCPRPLSVLRLTSRSRADKKNFV